MNDIAREAHEKCRQEMTDNSIGEDMWVIKRKTIPQGVFYWGGGKWIRDPKEARIYHRKEAQKIMDTMNPTGNPILHNGWTKDSLVDWCTI